MLLWQKPTQNLKEVICKDIIQILSTLVEFYFTLGIPGNNNWNDITWMLNIYIKSSYLIHPVVMFPNKNPKHISLYLKGLKGSSFCVLAGSRVNFVRERGFDVFSGGSDILENKKNNYLALHWCGALCSVWSSSSSLRVQSCQDRTDITFNFPRKGREIQTNPK